MPKQVEGGKESEVSHELESQENGTKVVKENDHKGEGYFCSVCGFDFKFQFKFEVGNGYSLCFQCDPCETRGSGQVPGKKEKRLIMKGKQIWS